jgi:tetratricopeptide (TPR) repeat protein
MNRSSWQPRDWVWALILILAIVAAYSPVWYAGFIWDDDDHVTNNPCIIGPLGLKEIWTTSAARYYPLVLTTFWLEHALWGLNPLFYHLVNVGMHAGAALVLWRVLLRLGAPGAWLGAAIWALHPVSVETVAWISEMKNTQSALFYLLSILFFLKGLGKSSRWPYALCLLFAAMAMTSKSSTVVLPLVLCLCGWWTERRWNWRTFASILPVFGMSLAAAALAMGSVELYGDVHNALWTLSWPQRLITAGYVIWFYLGKLAWPSPLIFVYPRWHIDATQGFAYLPLLAAVAVLALLWHKRESWGRPWFFTLAYFVAALLPVLGLVNHYFLRYSFVADHLQYLASMGPLALAGAVLAKGAERFLPGKKDMQAIAGAALLVLLGALSWAQGWVYANEKMLWVQTLDENPDAWLAHNNLGLILMREGHVDDAMEHFEKTLQINPNFGLAHYNLGNAYFQKGQTQEAYNQYQACLVTEPDFASAIFDSGLCLSLMGQTDAAIAEFQQTLIHDPNHGKAHYNLGVALLKKGQVDAAIVQFQECLRLEPGEPHALEMLNKAQAMKR